jgi:hypothetical protein
MWRPTGQVDGALQPTVFLHQLRLEQALDRYAPKIHGSIGSRVLPAFPQAFGIPEAPIGDRSCLRGPKPLFPEDARHDHPST